MTIRKNYLRFLALLLSGSIFLTTSCDRSPNAENATAETELTADSNSTSEAITKMIENAIKLAVAPPIKGVDVPYTEYQVAVAKGATLTTSRGSIIEIPANAFVDAAGQPIKGEVTIKFREFHTAAEIVASGIPMHNPETGEQMETAGMFDIKGEQNNAEIFVKGGKDINVNLVSYNEGDRFNFYELGAKDCRWKDLGTAAATPNLAKMEKLAYLNNQIEKIKIKPRSLNDTKNYVFDFKINYKRFAELKAFKNVLWEYTGKGKNPEKEEWIFSNNWDDIELTKNTKGDYTLTLSDLSGKIFKTNVRPVLEGKDYEKALASFNKDKGASYEKMKKGVLAERERVREEAILMRAFNVAKFGIHNWDYWQGPGSLKCQPQMMVENQDLFTKEVPMYVSYFLVRNGNSLVRYNSITIDNFGFDPKSDNLLLAIVPDGTVAVFSVEDFKALNLDKIKDTKVLFDMAKTSQKVRSVADLNKIITNAS